MKRSPQNKDSLTTYRGKGLPPDTRAEARPRGREAFSRTSSLSLRHPRTRRHIPPLRLPTGGRRCPEVLGRAQGPLDRPEGKAAGHAHRGPSARVREVRGRHPRRRVRRRAGDRVGRWQLPQPHRAKRQGGPGGAGDPGRSPLDLAGGKEADRRLRAHPRGRGEASTVAPGEGEGRAGRRQAEPGEDPTSIGAVGPNHRGGGGQGTTHEEARMA
jgi:hypothetical protein